MKRLFAYVLALMMVRSLAACGGKTAEKTGPEVLDGETTQIPNPWVECSTLADAEALAGFDFTVPDAVEGYDGTRYIDAIGHEMIEVIYPGADDTEDVESTDPTENSVEVRLRKAPGSEDISGDYNSYSDEHTAELDGVTVTLRGNDGLVMTAIWTDGDYAYSITCNGMAEDAVLALAASMH